MATVREHLREAHNSTRKHHLALAKAHSRLGEHHRALEENYSSDVDLADLFGKIAKAHEDLAAEHTSAAEFHAACCADMDKAVGDDLNKIGPDRVSAINREPGGKSNLFVRAGQPGPGTAEVPSEFTEICKFDEN